MINVGTLVTVDLDKARQFQVTHLLKHTGIGMILVMPTVWKHNVKGLGGLNLGERDPGCWVKIQFGDRLAVIPSDFLDFVEE
jgi:hypothetical protein